MRLDVKLQFTLKDKGKIIQKGTAEAATIAEPPDICIRVADARKLTDNAEVLNKLGAESRYVTVTFPKM